MNGTVRVLVAIDALAIVGIRLAYLLRGRKEGAGITRVRESVLLFFQAVGLTAGSTAIVVFVLFPALLEHSFLPIPLWLRYSGGAFGAAAVVLLGWSHHALGASFSPVLGTRQEHHLVRTGPYSFVRHPMYAAFMLQAIGFFLLTASWVVAAAWSPLVFSLFLRIRREEKMMIRKLGDEYLCYQDRTGQLLPRMRRGSSRPQGPYSNQ